MILIVAVGALWSSAMVADGAVAMSPIAGWLWLTVLLAARRAAKRERPVRPDDRPSRAVQQAEGR